MYFCNRLFIIQLMKNCLDLYKNLTYNSYKVQIIPEDDVVFDAWPGAVIRNNLLYAAEQIRVQKTGRSLREQIDVFPLDDDHPLYNELKEGFPKGYVLTDFSTMDTSDRSDRGMTIRKGELFTFSLLLIGHFNDYRFYFFEAIRQMCERGIGKPMMPFQLSAISETPPVSLSGFLQPETVDPPTEMTIRFLTPVILFRMKEKKNKQLSYQDKTNRFPGLYQLVRSSFSRLQKLYALYVNQSESTKSHFDETVLETYLEKAGRALLKSANIQHINLQNTQKKGMKNEMPLAGYTGEQTYYGNWCAYLPLLRFMGALGVGNETVYGMGRFEIVERDFHEQLNNEVKTLDSFLHPKETGENPPNEFFPRKDILLQEETDENQPEMMKLPILIVRFKNQISQLEVASFAEVLARKVHERFEDGKPYGYPLIQCKRINGKAAIICIGEGTEQIGGFFSSRSIQINTGLAGGQINADLNILTMELETVKAEKIIIQAWETNFTYTIRKYLPLSHENQAVYQAIQEDSLRYEWMENIVRAHIVFFTENIGIHLDKEIVCMITELEEKATLKYKNQSFTSFDLKFKTNVSLPDYIGLGIGVSHGFGTVAQVRKQKIS